MSTIDHRWPAAPATPLLAAGDVHLWSAALDLPPAAVEQLAATLSPDELDRAGRFRAGPLRSRFVVGRATLRAILARYLAADARQLTFQYRARGKPDLAPPWDRGALRFNLSHSHGLALFALAAGREVGVDLEWPRPVCHMAGMVERFFSADEQRQWHALPAADQQAGFFRIWTCKEAWLKATGAGMSFPLAEVSVSASPHEPPRLLTIRGDCGAAGQWHLACSVPAAGYVAALAVRGGPPRVNSWHLSRL
jgi:4'-phosphopantetheinyl transferase